MTEVETPADPLTNYGLMLEVNFRIVYAEDTVDNRRAFLAKTILGFYAVADVPTMASYATKVLQVCKWVNDGTLVQAAKDGLFTEDMRLMLTVPFFLFCLEGDRSYPVERIGWLKQRIWVPTQGMLWHGQPVQETRVELEEWKILIKSILSFAKFEE